jgi:hypothetical protein
MVAKGLEGGRVLKRFLLPPPKLRQEERARPEEPAKYGWKRQVVVSG